MLDATQLAAAAAGAFTTPGSCYQQLLPATQSPTKGPFLLLLLLLLLLLHWPAAPVKAPAGFHQTPITSRPLCSNATTPAPAQCCTLGPPPQSRVGLQPFLCPHELQCASASDRLALDSAAAALALHATQARCVHSRAGALPVCSCPGTGEPPFSRPSTAAECCTVGGRVRPRDDPTTTHA
jgi:hypothetical protein